MTAGWQAPNAGRCRGGGKEVVGDDGIEPPTYSV
jgi:hypothetical protein